MYGESRAPGRTCHYLAGLANQRDLTVRFMECFDHYLKGAPAPACLTEGMPYPKKDAKPPEPAKQSNASRRP